MLGLSALILTSSCGGYPIEKIKELCNREGQTFIINKALWGQFAAARLAQSPEPKANTVFARSGDMTKQKISFYWQSWIEPERINDNTPTRDDLTLMAEGKPFAVMKSYTVTVEGFDHTTDLRCIEATPEIYFLKASVPKWFQK